MRVIDQLLETSDQSYEYWIPAEKLAEFNKNIVGKIEVIDRFDGDQSA